MESDADPFVLIGVMCPHEDVVTFRGKRVDSSVFKDPLRWESFLGRDWVTPSAQKFPFCLEPLAGVLILFSPSLSQCSAFGAVLSKRIIGRHSKGSLKEIGALKKTSPCESRRKVY